jgi:hypothetical protein
MWRIQLSESSVVTIGSKNIPHVNDLAISAVIDSGAGYIMGPELVVDMIYEQLAPEFEFEFERQPSIGLNQLRYQVDCKRVQFFDNFPGNLPDTVNFNIDGKSYGISWRTFIVKDGDHCYGAIAGSPE